MSQTCVFNAAGPNGMLKVQGLGEGLRLAGMAVFAAEESAVAAREGHGGGPEPFGDSYRRTPRDLPAGSRARRPSATPAISKAASLLASLLRTS